MNYIELDGKRDFPFTTNVLKFMQDATAIIEKLAALGGVNYILSGCTYNSEDVVSNGFIVLNGRVMPFIGGTNQNYIKVVETNTAITVAEGTRNEISYYATFGASTTEQYVWGNVAANRFSLTDLSTRLTALESSYNARLLEKVINIGTWDMTADPTRYINLDVSLPGVAYSRIVTVQAFISQDDNLLWHPITRAGGVSFGNPPAGSGSNKVLLERETGGFFDSSVFNDGTVNRGKILIQYTNG